MKKTSLYITLALITAVSAAIWYRAEKRIITAPELDTITVGVNTEFPPFAFKHDDETITGFDIDVITEVFKRIDKKITFKDLPFDALIPEIQIGNVQVIAAGMTPTEERAKRVLFTKPHLTDNPLVIVSLKTHPVFSSLDDLQGKTVVVNEGYVADSFMSEQPGIELIRLSSALIIDALLVLQSGRADAFVTALHSMKPYFEKHGTDTFKVTPIPNTEETSAFAISNYYPELRYTIQNALDAMEEDGTLTDLRKKWNLA
jgi:ABC-type amino acid transport substrate-binding protein